VVMSAGALSVEEKSVAAKTFRRLVLSCTTPNQFNRVIISYERRITPNELSILTAVLEKEVGQCSSRRAVFHLMVKLLARFPVFDQQGRWTQIEQQIKETLCRWKSQSRRMSRQAESTLSRTFTTKGVALYQENRDEKSLSLLIAFTGRGQRLMMATPTFLHAVRGLGADVLVLRARWGGSYQMGVPSLGGSLVDSLYNLDEFVRLRGYRKTAVLGLSEGGIPALLSAISHLQSPFLAVGCLDPRESEHKKDWNDLISMVERRTLLPKGSLLVGKKAPKRDFDAADYLSKALDVPVRTVPGGHAPLHLMAERGTLRPVLREMFVS